MHTLVVVTDVVVSDSINSNLHTPCQTSNEEEISRVVLQDDVIKGLDDWITLLTKLGIWKENQWLDICLSTTQTSKLCSGLTERLAHWGFTYLGEVVGGGVVVCGDEDGGREEVVGGNGGQKFNITLKGTLFQLEMNTIHVGNAVVMVEHMD